MSRHLASRYKTFFRADWATQTSKRWSQERPRRVEYDELAVIGSLTALRTPLELVVAGHPRANTAGCGLRIRAKLGLTSDLCLPTAVVANYGKRQVRCVAAFFDIRVKQIARLLKTRLRFVGIAVDEIVDHIFGIGHTRRDVDRRSNSLKVMRGDAQQCIDRIFSRAGNAQQQEASHKAEVFVKGLQAIDVIRALNRPVAMPDKCCSQRV